jgi:enoyl-CoA hydratase
VIQQTVRYEERGAVALVTIDRPERMGALDAGGYAQLARAWRTIAASRHVRVAVITGSGRAFCAGSDLKDFIPQVAASARSGGPGANADGRENSGSSQPDGEMAVLRRVQFLKPIVAAVNGPCVASGMEMLLATDIRLASPEAVFGLPEVSRGLFSGGGSSVRLPRQVSYALAMEILLTGRYISADEALRFGVINRIVERSALLSTAMDIAETIAARAAMSPEAILATKLAVADD